jgi:hypothetical protein
MYLFCIKGINIMKKILFAFVFSAIITITSCGDKSAKTNPTPTDTNITTTITTSVTTATTTPANSDVEPENTTPTTVPANTTPSTAPVETAKTTPAEAVPNLINPAETSATLSEEQLQEQLIQQHESQFKGQGPKTLDSMRNIKPTEFKYETKPNGNLRIVKFIPEDANAVEFIIPNSYNGKTVDEIAPGVFCNLDNLISLTCPESITKIGAGAFSECDNLDIVKIRAKECELGDFLFDNSPHVTAYVFKNTNVDLYLRQNPTQSALGYLPEF